LDSDKPRMRAFTSTGKSNGIIVRENLDPTGEKRAARAKEDAENPLFNVITRKGGLTFATEAAAARELSARGMGETHEVAPASSVSPGIDGFVVKRKAPAPDLKARVDAKRKPESKPQPVAAPEAAPEAEAAPDPFAAARAATPEASVAGQLRKIADDITSQGTDNGRRALDTRWAEGAIRRMLGADLTGVNLAGKQTGPMATAKIALKKERISVEDLRRIAEKLSPAATPVAADSTPAATTTTPEPALPAAASASTDAQPAAPEPKAKRPPKSFRKKVKVTTPVFIEETGAFEPREIDADAALKALDDDITEMQRFVACLKG